MVCKRWFEFKSFLQDMGLRPSVNHSVGRKDNDGHYCPTNCEWQTRKQQGRNCITNRVISFGGESKTLTEWAEKAGLRFDTLSYRIDKLGWSLDEALTTPLRGT